MISRFCKFCVSSTGLRFISGALLFCTIFVLSLRKQKHRNMNTELIESTQIEVTQYSGDRAAVDVQVSTAKQFPRQISRCVDNAIAIVTMDKATAETCNYAVPRAGKAITGPSVHLAKIIAQTWGNLRCEARVIEIDNKRVTAEGICWDLESNFANKATVKRSILTKSGRMSEDMITVTGNAANSIALRNAIFSVIPKAVVDKVYGAALQMITGDLSDETKLKKKRVLVFKGLADTYGVTEEEVLSAIGKASINHVTPTEIAVLIGIGQSIKDGDTTVDEAFRGKTTKAAPNYDVLKQELAALFLEKAEHPDLPLEDREAIERIIDNSEHAHYTKAINQLKGLK